MKSIKILLCTAFLTILLALPVFAAPMPGTGYIYIGDSRFSYMDGNTGFSQNPSVWNVSVPGMGYGWLVTEAVPYVEGIKANNPQITKWYEIYGLGVNDIANADNYAAFYANRALTNRVILVSVNPVGYNCDRTNPAAVEAFNTKLRCTMLPYIDCYNYLINTGFVSYDGTHYAPQTDVMIKDFLTASVDLYTGMIK